MYSTRTVIRAAAIFRNQDIGGATMTSASFADRIGKPFFTLALSLVFLCGCGAENKTAGAGDDAAAVSKPPSHSAEDKAFVAKVKQIAPEDMTIYYVPIHITSYEAPDFTYEYKRSFTLGFATTKEGAQGAQKGDGIAQVPGELAADADATLYFIQQIAYPFPIGVRAADAPILKGAVPAPEAAAENQ